MSDTHFYEKLGNGAGMLISIEDLKCVPLSKARSTLCWTTEKGIGVVSWDAGEARVIPWAHYIKICLMEEKGETGEQTIKKYLNSLDNN